jgi:hypothetical protein
MADKRNPAKGKLRLTDEERHERFKEVAREVGASDDPKNFENAFNRVAPSSSGPGGKR